MKKRKGLSLLLSFALLLSMFPFAITAEAVEFSGGGTESDPYLISNLSELEAFRDYINAGNGSGEYFKQTANIDMSSAYSEGTGVSWTPIGSDYGKQFKGNFEGDGHKIKGLYINSTSEYLGLFGYVDSGGTVQNLGVDGTVSGEFSIGGVVGWNKGKIENCSNACTVSGDYIGGVAGLNAGTIENCCNTGNISGYDTVGGVVGRNNFGTLKNSYNTGKVSGNYNVGGITGNTYDGTIIYCYNTGTVYGKIYASGIIGSTLYDSVTNCYYLEGTANGGIEGADAQGRAEVKSSAEFATQSTFKDWDFDTVWTMSSDLGRPVFIASLDPITAPAYTVTIPESLEIGGTAQITAENVSNIPSGSCLSVTLSDSNFTLRNDKGAELVYTVTKDGKQLSLGDTVLAIGQGTEQSGSADLKFDLAEGETVKYAGNYQGYVTFNVSIE